MKKTAIMILLLGVSVGANADVWKWLDAHGDTHFVDTDTSIYTWVDELDKVHYSDKPEHVNAVSVQLVWHSRGQLLDVEESDSMRDASDDSHPDETAEEQYEREMAEAYYCKRATEIYDSYNKAPRLYKSNADGERAYLSDEEAAQTLADTKAKVEELCH